MVDISQDVMSWVKCCRDLWTRWFENRDDGDDEFPEVENALFSALVLSRVGVEQRPTLDAIYPRLSVTYINGVAASRSVCRAQKAGNILCSPRDVESSAGATFSVRSIDCLGIMLDGEPYVELQLDGGEFLLEPIQNLQINLTL